MKNCPCCAVAMERVLYEGFGVEMCPECDGHFVRKSNFEGIKRTRDTEPAELVQGAQRQGDMNSHQNIICPGCFMVMDKTQTSGHPKVEYDCCPSCSGIWLDPGELEMVQLVYEASVKGQAELEMREDFDEFMMSSERQARFRENLAKCKDPSYTITGAITGGIAESFIHSMNHHHHWD